MANISPLHRVIDAGRWDAERLLGRLVIVVHAAFLDAGFVPHDAATPLESGRLPTLSLRYAAPQLVPRQDVAVAAALRLWAYERHVVHAAFLDAGFVPHGAATPLESGRLPMQVGKTASTLSLRYAVPQLVHRQDVAEAAALRLCAYGRHVVFYVRVRFRDPRPVTYWVCVDALAAAPLLSGALDDTARALRSDARVAALWSGLTNGLCRRVLVDLCRVHGVVLEPTFMSLPGDAKVAILARLADGVDLAMVERTCTDLRRLVADRDGELWRLRYEELRDMSFPSAAGGNPPDEASEMSWKDRYVAASRRTMPWKRSHWREVRELVALISRPPSPIYDPTLLWRNLPLYDLFFPSNDRCDCRPRPRPELLVETVAPGRRRRRAVHMLFPSAAAGEASERSWKDRYVAASRAKMGWKRFRHLPRSRSELKAYDSILRRRDRLQAYDSILRRRDLLQAYDLLVPFGSDDRSDLPELPAETVDHGRRRRRAVRRGKGAGGHGQAPVPSGHKKRPRGRGGAIHSPSSRYRWKHR